ncbi:MAG: hypothetical protein JST54_01260 [Deltaproteobacteria bacterium]|nr:hypothetical protein [Deltaproteobacteria bacterium]
MLSFALNLAISATAIAFCSWLARRAPGTAGMIAALPLTSLLLLLLTRVEQGSGVDTTKLARGILLGLPLGSTFLLPFALAPQLRLGFWAAFGLGIALVGAGYFAAHKLGFS